LRVGEGPAIPGLDFNESQIRPPLYVPRDDDWIGDPEYNALAEKCKTGNYEECKNFRGGASGSGLSRGGSVLLSWCSVVATMLWGVLTWM